MCPGDIGMAEKRKRDHEMALTWGEFKEWVSQFVLDEVEIHYIDIESPREDRVDIDVDEDRGLGISSRREREGEP